MKAGSRRRLRWVKLGAFAILAFAGLYGAWRVTGRPVTIKRVRTAGLFNCSEERVLELMGVRQGVRIGRREARRIESELKKHSSILDASVSPGVTGTLHVRVRERVPVAWLVDRSCPVAADGVLLADISERDDAWVQIKGLPVSAGSVTEIAVIDEVITADRLLQGEEDALRGVWVKTPGESESWWWVSGGKRVRMSSPVPAEQIKRLRRFQRSFPEAWKRARRLDLRFADRVVVIK